MANYLKDIFNPEAPQIEGNLKFKDIESYQNFLTDLQRVVDTGEPMQIDGLDSLSTYYKTAAGKQIIDEYENISNVFFAPNTEKIPINIKTDFGIETCWFVLKRLSNEIVIENDKDSIVYMRITFFMKTAKADITYSLNPQKASSATEIIRSYNTSRGFLNTLVQSGSNKEFDELIDYLVNSEKYWKRVHEIEEKLEIEFNPAIIEKDVQTNIEILYLLIIKQVAIRSDLKDVSFEITDNALPIDTNKLKISFISPVHYLIYGKNIDLYSVSIIYDAVTDSIKPSDAEGKLLIKCSGTELHPMYKAYKGFITENAAKIAKLESDTDDAEYRDAKPIEELISSVVGQD